MATINDWSNSVTAAPSISLTTLNGVIKIYGGSGGTVDLSTDASNTTINHSTGSAAKTTLVGSTTTTSSTTIQSGSGGITIASTNGVVNFPNGTGPINISDDAANTAVNYATGAGAKSLIVGSTTTTSSLALQYGTSDMTLASATGTVMSALDTGEITYPLQSAFLASVASTQTSVTGNGTVYTIVFATEIYDQNSDYNGTSTFTAPVTGRYVLNGNCSIESVIGATGGHIIISTSNRDYHFGESAPGITRTVGGQTIFGGSMLCDMDSADTAVVKVVVSGLAGDTSAVSAIGKYSGKLIC